jgi:hypothetical protein
MIESAVTFTLSTWTPPDLNFPTFAKIYFDGITLYSLW